MRITALFFAFVLVFSSVALVAQQVLERDVEAAAGFSWEEVTSPFGEDSYVSYKIHASADGSVIAVLNNDGVYLSRDSGATWSRVPISMQTPAVSSIAVSDDGQRLIIAGDHKLHLSVDGGNSWQENQFATDTYTAGPYTYYHPATLSGDGSTIVFSTGDSYDASVGKVYISNDFGYTWVAALENNFWREMSVSDDGQVLYLGQGQGYGTYQRSIDGGLTWDEMRPGVYMDLVQVSGDGSVVAGFGGSFGISVSYDGGQTWQNRPYYEGVYRYAMSDNGVRFSSVSTKSQSPYEMFVVSSSDSGVSWDAHNLPQAPSLGGGSIALSDDGLKQYVVVEGRFWRTTGYAPTVPGPVRIISGSSTGAGAARIIWYTATDRGGAQSVEYIVEARKDGDETWVERDGTLLDEGIAAAIDMTGLDLNTDYEFRVSTVNQYGSSTYEYIDIHIQGTEQALAPRAISVIGGQGSVAVSWQPPADNGGAEISEYQVQYRVRGAQLWSDSVETETTHITIDGLAANTTYQFRVRAVTDAGVGSWLDSRTLSHIETPFGIQQIKASRDGLVLLGLSTPDGGYGYGDRLFYSSDAGVNWSELTKAVLENSSNQVIEGAVSEDGDLIAYTTSGTYNGIQGSFVVTSSDAGQTWGVRALPGIYGPSSVQYSHDNTLIADAQPGYVYSSTNNGVEWSVLAEQYGQGYMSLGGAYVNKAGQFFSTVTNTSDYSSRLVRTSNNGQSWEMLHSSSSPLVNAEIRGGDHAMVLKQVNIATSRSQHLRTTDGGVTWERVVYGSGTAYTDVSFAGSREYSYDGTDTVIHVSEYGIYGSTLSDSGSIPETPIAQLNGQSLENNPTLGQSLGFSGRAQPFDEITVTVHSDPVSCSTTADAQGFWSCSIAGLVEPGAHTVNIQVTSALDGTVTNLGPYAITVVADGTGTIIDNNTPLLPGAPNTGILGLPGLPTAPSTAQPVVEFTVQPLIAIALGSLTAVALAGPFLYRHWRKLNQQSSSL